MSYQYNKCNETFTNYCYHAHMVSIYILCLFCSTVAEVLALLDEESDDDKSDVIDIIMEPPADEGISDQDSDKSDGEYEFNANHLGRKLLSAGCEMRRSSRIQYRKQLAVSVADENSDSEELEPTSETSSTQQPPTQHMDDPPVQKKCRREQRDTPVWSKERMLSHPPEERSYTSRQFLDLANLTSPLQFFELFFDDDMITHITTQTNLYAGQHNIRLEMTADELRTVFGGILLSGYSKLPHRRMYWFSSDDVPSLLNQSIRRNRFDDILKHVHLADNETLNADDRIAKLRPFVSKLQEKFRENNYLDEQLSIDESMIPYYGRHFAKQYIRGKPVRFGFKNWALCSSSGYMYGFDIYTGKNMAAQYEYGLGGDVVLGLIEQVCLPPNAGHKVYFDNYFTSYQLLHHLRQLGYDAVGTVRENRCGKCPVKAVNTLKKEARGAYDYASTNDVLVIRWNDNSVVTIAANFGSVVEGKVSRWSNAEKKKVPVTRPTLFQTYNQGMGGVDQIDQQVACYRTRIRQRKWWWPIFIYLFDVTVVNAWYLMRKVHGHADSLLDFRRQLALTMLKSYGTPSAQGRRPSLFPSDVRYDGKSHWIVKGDTERRCKQCTKKTVYRCEKCDIGLHADCFKEYHVK